MSDNHRTMTAGLDNYTPPPWGTDVELIAKTAKSLGYAVEVWPEDNNAERIYLQFSDPKGDGSVQITPDDDYVTTAAKLLQFVYDCTEAAKHERLVNNMIESLSTRVAKIDCTCERNGDKITYWRRRPFYTVGNFPFSDWSHHYNRFFFKLDEIAQLIIAICNDEEIYRAHSPET